MALDDLNDKLYSRDFHRSRTGGNSPYDPREGTAAEAPNDFGKKEEWPAPPPETPLPTVGEIVEKGRSFRKRHTRSFILGAVALVLLMGGLAFKMRGIFFHDENIVLNLTGPSEAPSAEKVTFTVEYANKNLNPLKDVTLVLSYPESFQPEARESVTISRTRAEFPLGALGSWGKGSVQIPGVFSGFQGELAYLQATLRYTPSGLSSSFSVNTQLPVRVTPSPLALELRAPQEISDGQEVAYEIQYRNNDRRAYHDLRLKMEYPVGFRFLSAEPAPSEAEALWYLGSLNPDQEGKVVIRGVLSGAQNEARKVRATLGRQEGEHFTSFNSRETATRISTSPLAIFQSANGLTNLAVNPGEILDYLVKYRNDGNVGLRDVIVTVELASPYLNYAELDLAGGSYDPNRKMIIWKASDVPALGRLEPGAEGELRFTVPVLADVTVSGDQKNLSISSVAKIDSADLPTPIGQNKIIGSNTLVVRINSIVKPTLTAFYNDAALPNSGPLPPQVGKETTYTIHLKLANSSNDLTGARAVMSLPSSVTYKQKFSPASETIVYNERSNELSWNIGVLKAGHTRELLFQIGVTPSPSDANSDVTLMNGAVITGLDTFTKGNVQVTVEKKTNYIPEDAEGSARGSRVQNE